MPIPDYDACVTALAALAGIEPFYYDNAGQRHDATPATQATLLAAMGYPVGDHAALHAAWQSHLTRPWQDLVAPVQVLETTALARGIPLHLPLNSGRPYAIAGQFTLETGATLSLTATLVPEATLASQVIEGVTFGRFLLPLPADLPLGYHDLSLQAAGGPHPLTGRTRLIVVPAQVYAPPALAPDRRRWGLTVPLYALHSQDSWGIGDFADLAALASSSGHLGAAVLGLNPLHHLCLRLENNVSPYYPVSRLYHNPLYLRPELVPDLAHSPAAQALLASGELQAERRRLNALPQVDYPGVWALKYRLLLPLFDSFLERHGPPDAPRTSRGAALARFLAQEGDTLRQFATFAALSYHFHNQDLPYHTWLDWPREFQDPTSPAVQDFAAHHPRPVWFHSYLQWLIREQLEAAAAAGYAGGLDPGLYFDLAVGIGPGGFDTWAHPGLFALTANIGAPPDAFNPLGQNWGLAPLVPERLRADGYRYFSAMLRHNCRGGGILRLDHVMGLYRLFWIPQGAAAADGAYVRYDFRDLLGLVALESHRQQALIIGEDLGTVPPVVREECTKAGILSTRLFYFERTPDGAFRPPQDYPALAAAAITTHDLPTLAGYWRGQDLHLRETLHLYPDADTAAAARRDRDRDRQRLLELFQLPPHLATLPDLPPELHARILDLLARTPCRLALYSLEDIFGWPDQQNLPGTIDAYPNWRLKLPLPLEQIKAALALPTLAQIMAAAGRGV